MFFNCHSNNRVEQTEMKYINIIEINKIEMKMHLFKSISGQNPHGH